MSFAAPILLLLAILRTPLFVVIALGAMIGFYQQEVDLSVVSIEIYRLAEMPVLLAIPLFTFAGYLLGEGQASTRLVNLTNSLLGWMPGGLAIVTIFACALFTAFTGASGITIVALGGLLEEIAPARLFDESLKLFHGGCALQTFEALRHYGIFRRLFPQADAALSHEHVGFPATLITRALENTDQRIQEGKSVTPAFLLAAILWDAYEEQRTQRLAEGASEQDAQAMAADSVIAQQVARLAVPRRFTQMTREIWGLQNRFLKPTPKRARRLLEHPRFRAAYDFLALRAQAGEPLDDTVAWWTQLQEADADAREGMLGGLRGQPGEGKKPRRRRRRRPKEAT